MVQYVRLWQSRSALKRLKEGRRGSVFGLRGHEGLSESTGAIESAECKRKENGTMTEGHRAKQKGIGRRVQRGVIFDVPLLLTTVYIYY